MLLVLFTASLCCYGETTFDEFVHTVCKVRCADRHKVLNAAVVQADKLDVDFRLIIAIIAIESGFTMLAKNKGNVGLMQVLLKTHRKKFKKNPLDLRENIRVGSLILSDCVKPRVDIKQIGRCYNGGGDRKYPSKLEAMYQKTLQLKY